VNNQGRIQAQTVQGHGGTIDLLGGESGTVTVGGTLDASAAAGDGGAIETSGAHVTVADGAVITEKSHGGKDGRWLIDPQNFTIAASGGDISGATLSANLGSGDITIQSSSGGISGAGDILVNDSVSWSAHTLTLHADRNIVINAPMNGAGTAGLFLAYGQGASDGVIDGVAADYLVNAPINLASTGSFATQLGSAGTTIDYTILTSLGASGSVTGTDLQGIDDDLAGHYVLGSDIDASATANWNSGAGFAPIGTSSNSAFTGVFDGLGHTITGLTINRPSTDSIGLFGCMAGVVHNLGLVGGSVHGNSFVGSLAGTNNGTISDVYATGSVTASSNNVGGLVGLNDAGTINNAYATGDVSGGIAVGGLVGNSHFSPMIANAYATGSVSGDVSVGGLIGQNFSSIVSNAYATGSVTGTVDVGGLIGAVRNGGAVTNGYWDVDTTGQSVGIGTNAGTSIGTVTGGGGLTTAQLAAALPEGFDASVWDNAGGQTTPYLLSHTRFDTFSGSVLLGSDASATPTAFNVILNVNQLQSIERVGLAGNYVLGTDIDASVTAGWNGGAGFDPIGDRDTRFTGLFDGLGYTIAGLTIARPDADVAGLVGALGSNGVVRNVGLLGGSVSGGHDVGSLVGLNQHGTIDNVHSSANVSGRGSDARIGGLVGGSSGVITNAYATGDVTGIGDHSVATNSAFPSVDVGGLVGSNSGSITNVYATGDVTVTNTDASISVDAGGLAGATFGGAITNAYATGNVNGINQVGGLVGFNGGRLDSVYASGNVIGTGGNVGGLVGENTGVVQNAYATGSVSGTDAVGGLVGVSKGLIADGSLTDVYATGHVSGSTKVGGLVGSNQGGSFVTHGYWDTTTTGQSAGVGADASTGTDVQGLSTAQLAAQLPDGFDASVWDNAGGQTTPYLLSHASFDTVSGSVLLGSDAGATPTAFNVILNVNQLQSIARVGLAANYVLGADIDAAATAGWNDGAGFDPLGSFGSAPAFGGIFDGLGHAIRGLTIARPDVSKVGLFGVVGTNGVVRNVGLLGGSVSGNKNVGSLVGLNFGAIDNAYATTSVSGASIVGGLVGQNLNTGDDLTAIITHAYATGSVIGTNAVGGLVGLNSNGTIAHAYATGSVTGGNDAGGLVGVNGDRAHSLITDAYATGSVSGDSTVGGLVGENFATITNAYATGGVSGSTDVGGLVGINTFSNNDGSSNNQGGAISDVYATGRVSGSTNVGGLVGSNGNTSTIVHGYWDTETTGQSAGVGSGTNANTDVHGLTTAQMQQQSSFVGFDFDTPVWVIYDGHTAPLLRSFLTDLTVTADDQSQVYAGQSAHFGLSNAHFSIDGADTSGHLFGLDDPYDGAVNVGSYTPDLWSDQQGFFVTIVGGALTITPKALTLTGLAVNDKTYDGTTAATLNPGTLQITGLIGDDDVTLDSGQLSVSFADANAGTSKTVNVNGAVLTGSDAGNYTIGLIPTTASITPKTLTLTGLDVDDKVYDGSTAATIGSLGTLSGIVGNDQVSLSGAEASAAFSDANAGTGKTVHVTGLGLSGAASGNYVLSSTQADATADIARRVLTVAGLAVNNKEYDGTTAATVSNLDGLRLAGVVSGDDVGLDDEGLHVAFADANAGTNKAVTVSGLVLSGSSADNYELGASPTTASILRRVLTVSGVTVNGKVYDGNTAATIAGAGGFGDRVVSGDDVQLDLESALAAFADANAGNGKTVHVSGLGLSGADADNYALASSAIDATADIARRALIVSVVGNPTKTFDGSTDVSLDASNFRLDGFVAGEGAHLGATTGRYASADVGTGIAVSASLDADDFAANTGTLLSNYLLPEVATGLGSIIGAPSGKPAGIDPALVSAIASATRNAVWGYASLDRFTLPLDPRWQIRVQAHGPRQPVHLTIHSGVWRSQREGCSAHQINLDPFSALTDRCGKD